MAVICSERFLSEGFLDLLRCPECHSELAMAPEPGDGLRCTRCARRFPISRGVLRCVTEEDLGSDEIARHTRESFGYEWSHFNDWKPSGESNFADYFGGVDLEALEGRTVLDAGCGMGRHTRQIAPYCKRVLAIDFSRAIDAAARNVETLPNVLCVQGDLTRPPVAAESVDFLYSMGVLHHIADTEGTLRNLVRLVKPGGRVRIYLYWKRRGIPGALLNAVSLVRRLTVRLPHPVLRRLCWGLSACLFATVIVPYRMASVCGVKVEDSWPLAVYTKYPFTVLYNDQFDRFSAPIEKRYSEREARRLLESSGLRDVRVHARFGWIGDGTR